MRILLGVWRMFQLEFFRNLQFWKFTAISKEKVLAREMKRGMTIEYLKCRADLNFEVDIGVNGAFGTSVTKWDLILFGYFICFHP